jgi:hypothetical protein
MLLRHSRKRILCSCNSTLGHRKSYTTRMFLNGYRVLISGHSRPLRMNNAWGIFGAALPSVLFVGDVTGIQFRKRMALPRSHLAVLHEQLYCPTS